MIKSEIFEVFDILGEKICKEQILKKNVPTIDNIHSYLLGMTFKATF